MTSSDLEPATFRHVAYYAMAFPTAISAIIIGSFAEEKAAAERNSTLIGM
jgi:hypothetical protein